ncbi:MAG TPA: hypothetical protein VFM25_07485 [Verrucomicrobiae bacterium]|nr:hypothetical protein [Verrucomicrobiae bacterium]
MSGGKSSAISPGFSERETSRPRSGGISAEYNISDFGFLKATTNGVFWPKKVKQKIVLRGNFSYDSGIENGTARRPSTVQFLYA